MNLFQRLYPNAYDHLEKRSKEEFKGMLTALFFIDEFNDKYEIHFGLKSGKLFEKYLYCDVFEFEHAELDVFIEMIKQKMEQRGKHDVA